MKTTRLYKALVAVSSESLFLNKRSAAVASKYTTEGALELDTTLTLSATIAVPPDFRTDLYEPVFLLASISPL